MSHSNDNIVTMGDIIVTDRRECVVFILKLDMMEAGTGIA